VKSFYNGRMRPAVAALAAALTTGCSPFSNAGFLCTDDNQCLRSGEQGHCQMPEGRCSFFDASCLSGQRFGDQSGSLSGTCVGDNPTIDMGSGGGNEDMPVCVFGGFDVCDLTPDQPFNITSDKTLDTTNDPLCHARPQTGGPEVCLVYTTSATISSGATLTLKGNRPFVLVSQTTITVAGTIEGSSERGGNTGPGANFMTGCDTARVAENDIGGAAGASGGSFHGKGGDGGDGDTDNSLGLDGIANRGLAPNAITAPAFARGGCAGAKGANEGGGGGNGGNGGASGGAVWLIAGSGTLDVSGSVRAGGAGGSGGEVQSGGGGGGSGGYIKLVGTTVNVSGTVAANGGGGGEGGCRCSNNDVTGDPGEDAKASMMAAKGGNKPQNVGGDGGDSSAAANLNAQAGTGSTVGGGGGGGAAGFIIIVGTKTGTGTISPPAN
jgi:hypothetical protein